MFLVAFKIPGFEHNGRCSPLTTLSVTPRLRPAKPPLFTSFIDSSQSVEMLALRIHAKREILSFQATLPSKECSVHGYIESGLITSIVDSGCLTRLPLDHTTGEPGFLCGTSVTSLLCSTSAAMSICSTVERSISQRFP